MDFDIPEEFREIVGVARSFARNEMHDAEVLLDRMEDPVGAYTSDTNREVRRLARSIGLHLLLLPEKLGGLGLPPSAFYLVMEELAAGGPGLGLVSVIDPLGAAFAGARRKLHPWFDEYYTAFMDDDEGTHSGAWAITEPDVGCDIYARDQSFRCRAVPTAGGGGYVIDGAKSSWCSNGYLADVFIVMVAVEPENGMDGTGVFLIPADWPGVVRGKPIDKVGLRALNQCDIAFDGVEIPKEFLIFPPGPSYDRILSQGFVGPGNLSVGSTALGIAQAAFELGHRYAKEREQGGRPIGEHQLVAKKVFDAFAAIEASRQLLHKAAWRFTKGELDMAEIYAARVTACRTAASVTQDMVYLHGGNGITREYPIEKLWRDQQPLQMADGTTDIVSMQAAKYLMKR